MTRTVTQCDLCGTGNLDTVLTLGQTPPTCHMLPVGADTTLEVAHPLELVRCPSCTLVHLSVAVDPVEVFPPDYPYSSGNSGGLHRNFEDLAAQAKRLTGVGAGDLVVDIGANDGTLLRKFEGCRTIGVEPTGQARKIDGPYYQAFFTERLAKQIRAEHGPAKVITACNVLAHVEGIGDVMAGIKHLLAPDGMLIAENHDLGSVVEGCQWDTVYHEHLRFYTPYTFHLLLRKHGLTAFRWHGVPTHGGSFRMLAEHGVNGYKVPPLRHYDFGKLQREAEVARDAIRASVAAGTVGIGATARATTIINYAGLDVDRMPYVCEVPGSDKIGHYIPGTRIPVVDEYRLFEEQPARALLFSWHLADVIVPKLRERGYKGEIIVPLPSVRSV